MEIGNDMLQMIKGILIRQEEAEARQEKAEANAKDRQEKATAELRAAQAEMKADINANIEASQERANAELKAAQAEIEARREVCHERFLAFLDGLTSHGKRKTTCQRRRHVQKKWTPRDWKLPWKKQRPQWSGRNSARTR
jgi:membrane protein involved in colicin uptake